MRTITFELPALLVFGVPFLIVVASVAFWRERWLRRRMGVRDATAIQQAVMTQTCTQWRNPFSMHGVVSYTVDYDGTHYFAHLEGPRHPVFYAADTMNGTVHKIAAVVDRGTWISAGLTVLDIDRSGAVFNERYRVDAATWAEARKTYLSLIPE